LDGKGLRGVESRTDMPGGERCTQDEKDKVKIKI